MATYAIGDIQGCFEPLMQLLARIGFEPGRDTLWCVGDLVNRGPQSLETLRFLAKQGAQAVLGNHDTYALARAFGVTPPTRDDTLSALWTAPDRDPLVDWLLARPVMREDRGYAMVHAGLLPAWDLNQARAEARRVEDHLRRDPQGFLTRCFAKPRPPWSPDLDEDTRAAAAAQVFTRIRFVDGKGQPIPGSTAPENPPTPDARPWFRAGHWEVPIIFGHWAALGLWIEDDILALDSGCVWSNCLTAVRLEDRAIFAVQARRDGGD
jgi:bis(5'-nucleosyl)-tetraphosphatase (symmetrical)